MSPTAPSPSQRPSHARRPSGPRRAGHPTRTQSAGQVALRWVIGIAVGVAFTWLASSSWPMDALFAGTLSLESGSYGPTVAMRVPGGPATWSVSLLHVLGYCALLVVIHFWRVWRWDPLVRPFGKVPMAVLNRDGAIGFMGVFLLPLRLGEFVRPMLLTRDSNIAFGTNLSMIAVERIADGLMVTLMFFAVLVQVPATALARRSQVQLGPWQLSDVELGAWAALGVFGAAMAALAATAFAREATTRLIGATLGRLSGKLAGKILTLLTSFVDGLRVLGSPSAVLGFVSLTAAYWLTNGFGYWLLAQGFGLNLSLNGGYAMMCSVIIGMMIPNSPGNVGSFWYFLLLPASLFGIDGGAPRAIAFALALWALQLVQVVAFGLWGQWARNRVLRRG